MAPFEYSADWLLDLLEIEREHIVLEAPKQLAPDVGECFEYDPHGEIAMGWDRTYRVKGWMRREGKRRIFCTREEATHVVGAGVCGVIARVDGLKMIGRVDWTEELLTAERERANSKAGIEVF